MDRINEDLRELELKESDLNGIFWRAETEEGFRGLQAHIRQEYVKLLDRLSKEQMVLVRDFVASNLAIGAIRGLQWGREVHRRQQERRILRDKDATNINCILKHRKVFDLLLKKPSVGMKEICAALDDRDQELPWPKLANNLKIKDSRLWVTHARNQHVKSLITKARKRAHQITDDIRYLRVLMRKQRSAS
jgi:hypothetical protein